MLLEVLLLGKKCGCHCTALEMLLLDRQCGCEGFAVLEVFLLDKANLQQLSLFDANQPPT